MRIKPRKWDDLQQYKDRKPQWIKLHRDLLNDYAYANVRIGTKATTPLLWILACEYEEGIIDASVDEIAFRIHIDKNTVGQAIEELLSIGLFESLDESVQERTETYNIVPREEKRRDREETEKRREEFERFWKAYPKKRSKEDARKAYKQITDKPNIEELIEIINYQSSTFDWKKEGGKYIPYPATWLRSGGWNDVIEKNPSLFGEQFERNAAVGLAWLEDQEKKDVIDAEVYGA